jgi:hypothetical protein
LALVNGLLWRAEDDLRQNRMGTDKYLADLAIKIQDLNDRRAALVESINLLTGEHLGGEKVRG